MGFRDFANFNPFQQTRTGNIMSQPVDKSFGNVDFNPATQDDNPFAGNQKRLFTNSLPTAPKFKTPDVSQDQQQQPGGLSSDIMGYYKMLKEAGGPEPAKSAYLEALNNQPKAQDYQPSVWRRIGASITGAAGGLNQGAQVGTQLGENFLEAPYKGALTDYQRRIAGLEAAAKMEGEDADSDRQALGGAIQLGTAAEDKRITREQKGREMQLNVVKENREYEKSQAEIARLIAQTTDDTERRRLTAQAQRETSLHNQALEAIGKQNAGSASRQAGAAETSAGAAVTNAGTNAARQTLAQNEYNNPMRKPQDEQDARDLILEELMGEGMLGVGQNEDKLGQTHFTIDPKYASTVNAEVNKRLPTKLGRGPYAGRLPDTGSRFVTGAPVQR